MEESDLMKKRLHAITERHRIQEEIRRKKLELDQEKLKLQHLKKKSLREQWLLLEPTSHNATESKEHKSPVCNRQQSRELQLSIYRLEMEVESLEREESMITTNEGFILTRLRAVEKSSEDIIKAAQGSFADDPRKVSPVLPDVPQCISPPTSTYSQLNPPQKTVFAMEINVTKNLLTGESTVLSTATIPTQELGQHAGLKVFDDGTKCVYALDSPEQSSDKSRACELSAREVEHLLKSASLHHQLRPSNYQQSLSRRESSRLYSHQDEREVGHQRGHQRNSRPGGPGGPVVGPSYGREEATLRRPQQQNNQSNSPCNGPMGSGRHPNRGGFQSRSDLVSDCVNAHRPPSEWPSGLGGGSGEMNNGSANGYPTSVSHEHRVVYPCQPQLCYTPLNHIPLRDYISVEDQDLYCLNSPSSRSPHGRPATALYRSSALCDRVPSPLFGDDTPYTILSSVNTTEPVTAIFMGFQTAQDDSGQVQEFEGSLKAELVVIEDDHEHRGDGVSGKPDKSHRAANGDVRHAGGKRWTERGVGSNIRNMKSKNKTCCVVC